MNRMRFAFVLAVLAVLALFGGCASTDQAKTFSGAGTVVVGSTIVRDNLALADGNPNAAAIIDRSSQIRALVIEQDALWIEGRAALAEIEASESEPE